MNFVANLLLGVIALLHLYFLILEMFLWKKPYGRKVFGTDQATADSSAVLAANQGLYNGFLAAGIVWGMMTSDPHYAFTIKCFFLNCVTIAGVYGGITVNKKILFVQAAPALLALIILAFAQG